MTKEPTNSNSSPLEGMPKRSAGSPSRGEPDPEVPERPRRRSFTAQYKARIVEEVERCKDPGQIGALLRREGLYFSHLTTWRRQVRAHGVEGMQARKRGPAAKPKPSAKEQEWAREKRKLEKRLAKAEAIIEFQKKVHEILGIPLKHHGLDDDDS